VAATRARQAHAPFPIRASPLLPPGAGIAAVIQSTPTTAEVTYTDGRNATLLALPAGPAGANGTDGRAGVDGRNGTDGEPPRGLGPPLRAVHALPLAHRHCALTRPAPTPLPRPPARRAGVGVASIEQVDATTLRINFTRDLAPVTFTLPAGAGAGSGAGACAHVSLTACH
jgi:hypothetical protein